MQFHLKSSFLHACALGFLVSAALSVSPSQGQSAQEYLNFGQQALQNRNLSEAIRFFNQAVLLEPANVRALALRAAAKGEYFLWHEAVQDYTEALRLNPNESLALISRGILYIKMGEIAAAIADFDRALGLDPQNALAYLMRAEAKYKALAGVFSPQKPYTYFNIVDDYSRALALNPRFGLAFHQRGKARMDSLLASARPNDGEEIKAILRDWYFAANLEYAPAATFIEAYRNIENAPALQEKNFRMAQFKMYQGKKLEGLSLLNQIIEQGKVEDAWFGQALEIRASYKYSQRDYEGALADYQNLLNLQKNPGLQAGILHFQCGLADAALRRYPEARRHFDQAITLGYSRSWVYLERGLVLQTLGETEAACADFRESAQKGDARAADKIKAFCKTGIFRNR
ncbi:MAG: hypothetical protein OHK0053_04380 [Microscillaceae bacterium]